MCKVDLIDVGGESCEPTAGMSAQVLIAPVADFTKVGTPPEDMETYDDVAELATVADAHTFPIGKGFNTIMGVEETGTIKSTMMGEFPRHMFTNEAEVTVSGSKAKLLGWLRLVKNGRFVFLLEEADSGALRQLGTKRRPARFTGIEAAIEAATEGNNSVKLTIQDKQKWPAPVYASGLAVTMKPAAGAGA